VFETTTFVGAIEDGWRPQGASKNCSRKIRFVDALIRKM
jgi:hypothetical protein